MYWEWPYPEEQHIAWTVCGDPIATTIEALMQWNQRQNFKPPLPFQDLMDCLWVHLTEDLHRRNDASRYDIVRGNITIPDDVPDELWDAIKKIHKEEISRARLRLREAG